MLVQRDKHVDIAIGRVLPTRDRSEQTHVTRVSQLSCREQLGAVGGYEFSKWSCWHEAFHANKS